MAYKLKIYDNLHYMDDEEAYLHGSFNSYEAALAAAKKIVEEFINSNYEKGFKPEDLTSQYKMFGEDPVVINPLGEVQKFSAWNYAEEYAKSYCEKMESNSK